MTKVLGLNSSKVKHQQSSVLPPLPMTSQETTGTRKTKTEISHLWEEQYHRKAGVNRIHMCMSVFMCIVLRTSRRA